MFNVMTRQKGDVWEVDSDYPSIDSAVKKMVSILLGMKDPEWEVSIVDDDYGQDVGDIYKWVGTPYSGTIVCARGVSLYK